MAETYLPDTSAWVEYLRKTGSSTNRLMRNLISENERICMTEPVAMEVLAGTSDAADLMKLERLVEGLPVLEIQPRTDFRDAALLYRTVRGEGYTVRKMLDCLIATIALRKSAVLVHRDSDFDVIVKAVPALRARRE